MARQVKMLSVCPGFDQNRSVKSSYWNPCLRLTKTRLSWLPKPVVVYDDVFK